MTLTVLSVAYALSAVSPDAVGGAEQVLAQLDDALCASGQRSIVVAPEDSMVRGQLIPTPSATERLITSDTRTRAYHEVQNAIARALSSWQIDVMHFHGLDFAGHLPGDDSPRIVTLHLPPPWYGLSPLALERLRAHYVCVSESQRRWLHPGIACEVICNGVDLNRFRPTPEVGEPGYAMSLGRICPEKGFDLAVQAARRAGVPLLLAGRVFPYEEHERYFDECLTPLLDAERRFIGPVNADLKSHMLASAMCVVIPSLAQETSSLVAMEALACGTPVVAFASGALPEIIEHGVTGFIVRSVSEMAEAIRAAGTLDRNRCRQAAVARFSLATTQARYLELYQEIGSDRGTIAAA